MTDAPQHTASPDVDMGAARVPSLGLPGLDPAWSRLVTVPGRGTFHVLERPATGPARLTVLAVHGNPTWSYLWRRLLDLAPPQWRVLAVDQLGMGYSERVPGERRLADRVDDLGGLTGQLGVEGPVVTVAHDWGGPVSLGWGLAHRDQWAGAVLTNTAVHQPSGAPAPTLIRLARMGPMLRTVTERTPAFVRGTTRLSRDMPADVAEAFAAPYADADARRSVRDFVADIPLEPDHPSAAALDAIAEGITAIDDIPVLLAWGSDDPVFSDRYLRDLVIRMPHADVHRYEKARHLVTEDAPTAIADIVMWIDQGRSPAEDPSPPPRVPSSLLAALLARGSDGSTAIADLASGATVSWRLLAARTTEIAAGLLDLGVRPGDRVALLVPPGPDLLASVYACWRIGAVGVAADAGLGVRGIRRALRSAEPDHVIAIPAGLALARTIGIPGARILAGRPTPATRALQPSATLSEVARRGRQRIADQAIPQVERLGPEPDVASDAIVVFTSGATGPPKGVVYTHGRLRALRDALRSTYGIRSAGEDRDALVAAFAPWAVLGPALGIASAIPDMSLTDASTLTAPALAAAIDAVNGTFVWTSPTALRALVSTAGDLDLAGAASLQRLRLVLAAGAPVPVDLLDEVADLVPDARIATPYGMTEALPLTDVSLAELREASGNGVLVGHAIQGVDVAIAALHADGSAAEELTTTADITGEIVVRVPWGKDRYDRRWATQHRTASPAGWHRTGDVGHLDELGRLWVEGRHAHVIVTAHGSLTPVGIEITAARSADVALAACVGVGPTGTQVPVVVLPSPGADLALADVDTTLQVREAVRKAHGVDIAAVATMAALPVDVRHRSKVDRLRIARDVGRLLAGDAGDPA